MGGEGIWGWGGGERRESGATAYSNNLGSCPLNAISKKQKVLKMNAGTRRGGGLDGRLMISFSFLNGLRIRPKRL